MRRLLICWSVACFFCGAALAQERDEGRPDAGESPQAQERNEAQNPTGPQDQGGQEGQNMPGSQEQTGSDQSANEAPATVTLDDARMSIASLIQAFIAERSPNGYWPLFDKSARQRRKLKLISVDESKTKSVDGMRFSAPARLKDLRNGEILKVVFTVNFTGPKWSVVGMRLLPPPAGKKLASPNAGHLRPFSVEN